MIQGSIVAIVTPFSKNGHVEYDTFRDLISWHLDQGTDGVVIAGTTGESPTLNSKEKNKLLQVAIEEVKGRIPVIMGTGSNDTLSTIENTIEAKKLGADACLVIVPYYNRPSFEGCYEHYKSVANIGLPVIVYHHPGRTGVRLTASQLKEICSIDGICGLKESSGDVDLCLEFIRTCSKPLFSGDDTLTLPLIALGAKGVISVAANVIPKEWKEFTHLCLKGDFEQARSLLYKYTPLCRSLFLDSNPQGVKCALSVMQKIEPHVRLPLLSSKETVKSQIVKALSEIHPFNLSNK